MCARFWLKEVPVKVIVSGATGLIGRHLVAALAGRGDEIAALSRGQGNAEPVAGARMVPWEISTGVPAAARQDATAIINLAGANIGTKRWRSEEHTSEL